MKIRYWIAAVALLSLALGACQSSAALDTDDSQETAGQAEAPAESNVETEGQEPELLPTTQESEASGSEANIQEEPTPFQVRQGLSATDPATVNLGNGTPTLVEFFAFW